MKWFGTTKKLIPIEADIHSHLIPGIDDGSTSMEKSIEMIEEFERLGFKKIITTPHIHPNYPNSKEAIISGVDEVKKELERKKILIELEAAAEYFVDETFVSLLDKEESLLSFGDHFVLVECSFTAKPFIFETVIYKMKELGYSPVFAHPERYKFLEGDITWLKELKNLGILFQVTLGSLSGYYGNMPKKLGLELVKNDMVDFLASDLHRVSQIDFLRKGLEMREVQKLIKRGRLFNSRLV